MQLSGTFTALITPFKHNRIDTEAIRRHVEQQIEGGVSGLVPCGTTGESVTLTDEEHLLVIKTVVEQCNKRVPVFAGAGTVSTAHSIHLAQQAQSAGADGLLLVCPYYNKPTQAGLEAHFRAILAEVPMPSMLYNIPGRTSIDLHLETLKRLSDVSHIIAMKEATGNVVRAQAIIKSCGDRYAVFSGDDALTLPMMASGAKGVVSVTSNAFPSQVSAVTRAMLQGDLSSARQAHMRMLYVHEAMFTEANPGPIKALLHHMSMCESQIRLPLVWPAKATLTNLLEHIEKAEL